ncbi:hypothetical protein QB907_06740 [Fusobacterium nucleatum]|nr:hypothetical protein [Fusobacterium nucleatum]
MIFRYLTSSFFTDYVNCTQMLQKQNRPYTHIIIEIDEGLNFALPIINILMLFSQMIKRHKD